MPKRIFWKKGMRLTDEVLTMSDNCTAETLRKVLQLASGGSYGLFCGNKPFSVSIDINNDVIDVLSITCLAITRDGTLIDVDYNTNYTNSFDTRTIIHNANSTTPLLLCISPTGEWRESNNGLCEPAYSFFTIDENTPVPANSLPIAHIVYDEFCWRVDDIDFVPPCVCIAASEKYVDLYAKFHDIINRLDLMLPQKFLTAQKDALKIYWPIVQQMAIAVDKERDNASPMTLLSNVQRCISGFLLACALDDYINLGEPAAFQNYIRRPYNAKSVYKDIKEGLELCSSICFKVEGFAAQAPAADTTPLEAPSITRKQLKQAVEYGPVTIRIQNNAPGSVVHYTTDGSMPTASSMSGNTITVESGFKNDWHKEPAKSFTLKLISIKDGQQSDVATFQLEVKKGKSFDGPSI